MGKENLKLRDLCVELTDKHFIRAGKTLFKIASEPEGIRFDYSSGVVLAGLNEYEGMKIGTPCRPIGSSNFYRIKSHFKQDVFFDGAKKYIVVSFVRVTGKYAGSKAGREQVFYALAEIGYDSDNAIVTYLEKNDTLNREMREKLETSKLLTNNEGKVFLFTPCQVDSIRNLPSNSMADRITRAVKKAHEYKLDLMIRFKPEAHYRISGFLHMETTGAIQIYSYYALALGSARDRIDSGADIWGEDKNRTVYFKLLRNFNLQDFISCMKDAIEDIKPVKS